MMKEARSTLVNGALVGVGGYGRIHLSCLLHLVREGRIRLCAAVHTGAPHEADSIKKLQAIGCELFTDFDEMLGKWGAQLDFCALPTSIPSHVPLTLKCVRKGIHTLVEKPLTGDPAHLEALQGAMKENPGVLVTVGFQSLFQPEIRQVREDLADGKIGRLLRTRVIGAWPRSHAYYRRNDWAGNIRSREGLIYDSPMNNAMAHYLNLALYWGSSQTGAPANVVSVEGALYRAQNIENFDTGICHFHLDCGVTVGAWLTHSSRELIPIQIVVDGEEGSFVWDCDDKMQWEKAGRVTGIDQTEMEQTRLAMFSEFMDVIEGMDRPQCRNVPHAAAHVRAIQKLQATIPVKAVDPSLIQHEKKDGENYTYIAGIEERLLDGFNKNKRFTLKTA